jgi:hypothetical protein
MNNQKLKFKNTTKKEYLGMKFNERCKTCTLKTTKHCLWMNKQNGVYPYNETFVHKKY